MASKAIGVKLKALRLKNGFLQDELAESAGVSFGLFDEWKMLKQFHAWIQSNDYSRFWAEP
ncbi:helix-turn-helix domain-containing protein [Algoriphagus antarcticus]|uniref:HTH cro/C1-type domain-containing protein n=1 Tax=Algoriphagus antarcticus TaxID=238540 RepID=A0A3E0DKU0_9BACT|nr:hypothetical protein [Algoriphagus antarcticus]REG83360.1 hypothetical protein C8N25_1185 [Algoriphagus antarcticus]